MNHAVRNVLAAALIVAYPGAAFAEQITLAVEGAWARASIGTDRPSAAYMTIRNSGEYTEVLTGLRSDLATRPEIHLTSTDDQGVSSMLPTGAIVIAPGEALVLEPGGLHVMLMRLSRPMVEGETFFLTLEFADDVEATVEVPILGIAAQGPAN